MAVSPKVFRVATYINVHAFTLAHKVIFGAIWEMVKNWSRTFHNNEMTQTCLLKQIISV